jgi:hypothetical protein
MQNPTATCWHLAGLNIRISDWRAGRRDHFPFVSSVGIRDVSIDAFIAGRWGLDYPFVLVHGSGRFAIVGSRRVLTLRRSLLGGICCSIR